jgi:hypothetical protein
MYYRTLVQEIFARARSSLGCPTAIRRVTPIRQSHIIESPLEICI